MYTLPRTAYPRKLPPTGIQYSAQPIHPLSPLERIKHQLANVAASRMAINSLEGKYLPQIIHTDEQIQGVVYGKSVDGMAMLIATDRRAIFLDKKPLFVNEDEVTYDVVSGVSHGHVGIGSTVTLHTRIKDFTIKTLNEKSARIFIEAIEARCVEHQRENIAHEQF